MNPSSHSTRLAIRPTSFTLYMRRCLVWQLLRFIIINLRMTAMIVKSHHTRVEERGSEQKLPALPAIRP